MPTKTKSMLWSVLLLAGCLASASCSDDEEERGEIPEIKLELSKAVQTDFAKTSNAFANKLLLTLMALPESQNQNVCVSPVSFQYLLTMVANGASTSALNQIQQTLDMEGYTMDAINAHSLELMKRLAQDNEYVKVALANGVWGDNSVQFVPAFAANMKNFYQASVEQLDFIGNSAKAAQAINQWADEHTDGMVKEISLPISSDTRFVLANATYFNGKWSLPFNKRDTRTAKFYNENGTTTRVDMMTRQMDVACYEDDNLTAAELNYGKGYYSMILVMPKDSKNLYKLCEETDLWQLHEQLAKGYGIKVELPRFKSENHWKDMADIARAMGITQIFSVEGVPGICTPAYPITKMTQDVVIEVTENGTKAAAVSAGEGEFTSPGLPQHFRFDHPFFYAIRENTTGTILFAGKVGKL